MRYLKTYEIFFKKSGLDKLWNKIIDPNDDKEYKASWNMYEIPVLQKYGKITEDEFEYNSVMTNLSIKIKKKYIEQVAGYAPATFYVNITDDNGTYSKTFTDFNDVEELIEKSIPEGEIDANKYNL